MSAVAIIFGYIESLFPLPLGVPGIKLGLGNIAVIVCLYLFKKTNVWSVMLIKVIVTSMLFSSPTILMYSLAGGVLSLGVMLIMKKFSFNIVTVSIGGGIFHNLGQLAAATVILGNINVIYYLPVLIISGILCGTVTGIVTKLILPRITHFIKQ